MAELPRYRPGTSFLPGVLPPSHAGPPPPPPPQNLYHHRQIHASRPPSQRSHGVRPPAVPTVPMRAPAVLTGGTSEDLQQIPCHSIPHPLPSLSTPPFCRPSRDLPPVLSPPNGSTPFDTVSIRVDRPLPEAAWEASSPVPAGVHSAIHFGPLGAFQTRETSILNAARMNRNSAGVPSFHSGIRYRVPSPTYLAPGTRYLSDAEGRIPSTED